MQPIRLLSCNLIRIKQKRFIFLLNKLRNSISLRSFATENQHQLIQQPKLVKYEQMNGNDALIDIFNNCKAIQQVFDCFNANRDVLKPQHLTQCVLVLWDIQNMFYYINSMTNCNLDTLMADYSQQLQSRPDFINLLKLIGENLDEFSTEATSLMYLYLNRIGVPNTSELSIKLGIKLEENLIKDESINIACIRRFVTTNFTRQNDFASILSTIVVLPKIYAFLDQINSNEDLELVTICLKHLNYIVPNTILTKYKKIVDGLLDEGQLDLRTIVKIIQFLNYPQWRDESTSLLSKLMLPLKNNLNKLNVNELLIVYETFCKINEPAEILNEMQRISIRYLHKIEEEYPEMHTIKLRLLKCIISFSTTAGKRKQYENIIRKYNDYQLNFIELEQLYFIIVNLKLSDTKLFWEKVAKQITSKTLPKIINWYLNYVVQTKQRNYKFETSVYEAIENEPGPAISTDKFITHATFLIAFGRNAELINRTVSKINKINQNLNVIHCLNLTRSLRIAQNNHLDNRLYDTIDLCVKKALLNNEFNLNIVSILLKICSMQRRNDVLISQVLARHTQTFHLSSVLIKNLVYSLEKLNILVPNLLNDMCEYVINNKHRVLCSSALRVLYLCSYMGFIPDRCKEFCAVFKNLLARDFNLLNGLLMLQSHNALAYLNEMSVSDVKHIFNVEFLDRLDVEMANCYDEAKYPLRIRNELVKLNRVCCLDYPELNIPWFHSKFVEQLTDRIRLTKTKNVQIYLDTLLKKVGTISKLSTLHYGYVVDILIDLRNSRSIAVLLLPKSAYTLDGVQLLGEYQTKIRHLEILGYNVMVVNLEEFNKLVFGADKMQYIKQLIKV